jgi:cobalt/nickel transport protein
MDRKALFLCTTLLFLAMASVCSAHFGMVIPSDSMVMQQDTRVIHVAVSFSHPMEQVGMDMEKPGRFGVVASGKEESLVDALKETRVMGRKAWKVEYKIGRPGLYAFFLEPAPYWEPAEDCFIVHYTKTFVAALGGGEGWDEPLGLKTEIVPLTRPFGLYAGNTFQGVVLLNGKPVPHAKVEVEFDNREGKAKAPTDYMVAQVVKADKNGVFTFTVPRAGWWGFAALNPSDLKMKHNGADKEVELGAVIWVEFLPWQEK